MPDPDERRHLAQQARLWTLSLICATIGSLTVWRTGSLATGILAFTAATSVFGGALWLYERRRRR